MKTIKVDGKRYVLTEKTMPGNDECKACHLYQKCGYCNDGADQDFVLDCISGGHFVESIGLAQEYTSRHDGGRFL